MPGGSSAAAPGELYSSIQKFNISSKSLLNGRARRYYHRLVLPYFCGHYLHLLFIHRPSKYRSPRATIYQSSEEQSSHDSQGTGLVIPLIATADNEKGDKLCDVGNTSAVPSKRPYSDDLLQDSSPMQKRKMRTDENFKQILSSYEDEFTCPM